MGAEEHDIVARFSRSSTSSSTGALAAHLARACGHVLVDERVIRQGYTYFAEFGDEIPAFFNKRISTGSSNVAITLQAGFDPEASNAGSGPFTSREQAWGEDPFSECNSTADAQAVIDSDDYHASLWLARITVGVELHEVISVSDPLFIAKHPNEFRVIAEELVALGVLQGHACPMCSDD